MPKFENAWRLARRWFSSILFFIVLGLASGGLLAVWVIPEPVVAAISISGAFTDQEYADDILAVLKRVTDDSKVKAVVLYIDSPGGGATITEQMYLDLLRLRQKKPLITSVGTIAASGAYYAAVASNYIYAEPTSQIGSIGVWVSMPQFEKIDEDTVASGPFKATGGSRRRFMGYLEMVRQGFVDTVILERADRLQLTGKELSRAEIYLGVEALQHGLIDGIGTKIDAIEKAAELAGLRNYGIDEVRVQRQQIFWILGPSDLEVLKEQTGLIPSYYYLYFEPR